MIRIEFDPYMLTIKGHAGYAPAGYDIVCSGVTAIAQTLAECLSGNKSVEQDIKPGDMKIAWHGLNEQELSFLLFSLKGFELIADEFPEYVQIKNNGLLR